MYHIVQYTVRFAAKACYVNSVEKCIINAVKYIYMYVTAAQ